ncbi:hypothetical protein ABTK77_20165, partial [Acinetobacter baumannii]
LIARTWTGAASGHLYTVGEFIEQPRALLVVGTLTGVAITGGMYVVPLYAFLTTTVTKDQTARTVVANNVVNAGSMVTGAAVVI